MIFHTIVCGCLIACLARGAAAQQNITIDDTNPAIAYAPAGAWVVSANSSLDFGGAHMLTQNPNGTATFNFTGIAVFLLSPKWPYTVNTAVALDGGAPVLVDLVDHTRPDVGQGPETVQFSAVWGATGLNNTQHTLVISVGAGQPFGVVDGITYTVAATTTSTSATMTSSSAEPPSTTTSTVPSVAPPDPQADTAHPKKLHVVPIVVGALLGGLGLFVVGLALCFACKRRRPTSEAWSDAALGNERSGYALGRTPGGAWRNTRYGYVGMPPGAPPSAARAPNRYAPGAPLSTITEKSTPRVGDAHVPLSPAQSPASALSAELPSGYYTAPGSEADSTGIVATLDAARRPSLGALGPVSVQAQPPRVTRAAPPEYVVQSPPAGWI
ncbi:hypothetical protein HYPSUDRAFT_68122 [Hypholoma sublateritium FD-334 SS-4]|uniref:Mid2 domain-containing protein n=1 Tax=Hypholoma sublateritium (strain FD-334 SS-4) TaxID=945553 RepID=A0A0D2L2M7_HYPSF|nr:hypothetical protein HYPSUDRAFT_68122 [Hypholoma sublateritium FD-334 SS-4]